MSGRIIADTDVVIDLLRGNKLAISFFRNMEDSIHFSAITVAEIYAGVKGKQERIAVERLFSVFPVVATTNEIACEAGKLVQKWRASHSVEIPDAIIAATCLILNAELSTLNVKHYPMFADLEPPYRKG
ncbi:MAG: PIN domain-containing protein [Desulfuromusa sp.]|nr:PIN domain-containing protein [Desulfuromusa sp.]